MTAAAVAPFAEALRATVQPCTFLLLVPTLAAVAAGRARWDALVATLVAAIVGGWLLADNRFVLDGWLLRSSSVVVMILLAVLVGIGGDMRRDAPRPPATVVRTVVPVGVITLVATQWWRPCVGVELGTILNGAQDGLAGQLAPMASYMVGLTVPVAALVLVRYAAEPPVRVLVATSWGFAAVGVVVAGFVAAGHHDSVTTTLTRWTLG